MAIPVWTLTLEYDGAQFLLTERADPHGAHDVGVAPWKPQHVRIPVDQLMDDDVAFGIKEYALDYVDALVVNLRGAWSATVPLF